MAAHRTSHAPEGEPLVTDTRIVRDMKRQAGSESDPGINLAALFRDVNEIEVGDEVTIEVYRDRYVVYAPDGEG